MREMGAVNPGKPGPGMESVSRRPRSARDDAQSAYWDGVATTAAFTQPLRHDLLRRHVRPEDSLLDFGCGYGRVLEELQSLGFADLTGVDTSPEMIRRARTRLPGARLLVAGLPPLPFPDASFHTVLLFAVLTCQMEDGTREGMVKEAFRILRPGGVLYVADFPIQRDTGRTARYERFSSKYGRSGAFETEDGAALRHLEPDRFQELVDRFTPLEYVTAPVQTMKGNPAVGFQYLGRRPPEPS